ncbi:MAG: CoB--CoM heterodisulfide reductase iron-sulfur subunit B family protein [Deltaproteobacteria bacterium]|nr:CoB--CoM heterodisulfide reductase iron-sulfur subunit B family protein [Deltaproteobacteria bacterium]
MRFALFFGCNIPARVTHYADATMAVLKKVDVEFTQIPAFNCCGYPVQNFEHRAFILSTARNLALAEKDGLDMLVLCKCCYGAIKKGENLLKTDAELQKEINLILAGEGLKYEGSVQVKHLLSVLYHDVGLDKIKNQVLKPYEGLVIAPSYGCHALRPSHITQFDDPVAPKIFGKLVEITGAYSIDWAHATDCCGAPLLGINDDLSTDMAKKKLGAGKKTGAHFICTACPYCQMQFDVIQKRIAIKDQNWETLSSILYPQLLGLAMGIDKDKLGINNNRLDVSGVTSFLGSE